MMTDFFKRRLADAALLTDPSRRANLRAFTVTGFSVFAAMATFKPGSARTISASMSSSGCVGPYDTGECSAGQCSSEGSGCSGDCHAVQGFCESPSSACWYNSSGYHCCDCHCHSGGNYCYCKVEAMLLL